MATEYLRAKFCNTEVRKP